MEQRDLDETRVQGWLPNLDIEIVHRQAPDSDAEFVTVTLKAVLYRSAFDVFLPVGDPFRFWTRMAEVAWAPWLQGLRALTSQSAQVRHLSNTADD